MSEGGLETDETKQAGLDAGSQAYSIMATPSVMGIQWKIEKRADKAAVGSNRRIWAIFGQESPVHQDTLRDVLAPQSSGVRLPPGPELLQVIHRYFRTVNRLFPIYNEEEFVKLVKRELLSQDNCRSSGLWVSLNMMLAFCLDVRSRGSTVAYDYFRNALSILPSTIMLQEDLLSTQGLLAMVRCYSPSYSVTDLRLTLGIFTGPISTTTSQHTIG